MTNFAARLTAEPGYGTVAKILHWLIFLLMSAEYIVGETMPHIRPNTPSTGLVAWHVSIGTAILFFMLVRVLWRFTHPVPALSTIPVWQKVVSHLTHIVTYLLIFVIVVLGWSAASFEGWNIPLFGVVNLPALAAKGTRWAHDAGDVHDLLAYVLLAVLAVHVMAALYHYLFMRDKVLQRMLPGIR